MEETNFYKCVENVIVQQGEDGEAVVIRMSEDILDGDDLFVLNTLGYALWAAGKEKKQIREVIKEIHMRFPSIDIDTITKDVLLFLNKMREKGLIQITD